MEAAGETKRPKRVHGTGSIGFHQKSRLYQGRYTGRDGKRHSVYAESARAVERKMADARAREGDEPTLTPAQAAKRDPIVVKWLLGWVEGDLGHPGKWRPSTRHHARDQLNALVESKLWEGRRFSTIALYDVQQLLNAAAKGKPTWKRQWGAQSVYHLRSTLSVGFGDAIRLGVVALHRNPVTGATVPALPTPIRTALEDNQRKALIDEALKRDESGELVHRLGDLVAFLALSGLRSGESRALSFQQVDLKTRQIYVNRTISRSKRKRLDFGPTKSDASQRPLALRGQALEILQRRRRDWVASDQARKRDERVEQLDPDDPETELRERFSKEPLVRDLRESGAALVWSTANGGPLDGKAISNALREIIASLSTDPLGLFEPWRCGPIRDVPGAPLCRRCDAHHWPPFNVHTLRSVAISYWIRKGEGRVSTLAAARRAGHSDVAMVQKVYGQVSRAEDEAIAAMDEE
jgi:integrase